MPAHPDEVREAEEEGITLLPGRGPEGDPRARRPRRRPRDARRRVAVRRQRPVQPDVRAAAPSAGSTPTRSSWPSASSPTPVVWRPTRTSRSRRAAWSQVDPRTLATTMAGVYCGGDLAFGPRIVIEAEADGKRAALAIHESLGGGTVPRARARFRPIESEPRRRSVRPDPAPDRSRLCRSRGAPASAKWKKATATSRRGSRRRAACGATSRRSSTRRDASCAAAAWRFAPRRASRSCRSRGCVARPQTRTRSPMALERRRGRGRHREGRGPVHPVRPVRGALPDRRHHDGSARDRRIAADRARAVSRSDERGARR